MRHILTALALFLTTTVVNAAVPPEKASSLDSIASWCAKLNPQSTPELAHFRTAQHEVAVVWIQKTGKKLNSRVVTYSRSQSEWVRVSDIEIWTNGMGLHTVQMDKKKQTLLYMTRDGTVAHRQDLKKGLQNTSVHPSFHRANAMKTG
jgi:hypothetical protein